MATAPADIQQPVPARTGCWWIALTITLLISVVCLFITVSQFLVDYLYDQNPHTRTWGGILVKLLGVVGIALPIVLLCNRGRFLSLPRSRQWSLTVGTPIVFVALFIICFEASLRSTYLILPRPTMPTAVLRYQPGESRIEFQGRWGGGGGRNDAEIIAGVEHFSSHIDQSFIDGFLPGAPHHPDRRIVTVVGKAQRLDQTRVQIVLAVDAAERFQLTVENLDDVQFTRQGEPVLDSVLPPGTYEITVVGQEKGV